MKVFGSNSLVGQAVRLLLNNQQESQSSLIDAGGIDFTPSVPGNWANPKTIADALNQLANPAVQTNYFGPAGPTAGNILFDTALIPVFKAGSYLVSLCGTIVTSVATTLTLSARLNGATIGAPTPMATESTTAGGSTAVAITYSISGLGPSAPNTFGISIVQGAGNISVAANGMFITTLEL
jgi:hypothetical protein